MIMVSHDRAFLDATVTDIARLSEGNLDSGLILTVGGVCVWCVWLVGSWVGIGVWWWWWLVATVILTWA